MKDQILENLNKVGICVIEDYFPKEFCNQAVNDIEEALNKYPSKIQSESKEKTSGDYSSIIYASSTGSGGSIFPLSFILCRCFVQGS